MPSSACFLRCLRVLLPLINTETRFLRAGGGMRVPSSDDARHARPRQHAD